MLTGVHETVRQSMSLVVYYFFWRALPSLYMYVMYILYNFVHTSSSFVSIAYIFLKYTAALSMHACTNVNISPGIILHQAVYGCSVENSFEIGGEYLSLWVISILVVVMSGWALA